MIFNFFFTNFFYQFCWQIFLTSFFCKEIFLVVILRVTIMVNNFFFHISKNFLDQALKTTVLDVSWTSPGLFSLKQVFFHLDFIVSSMHLDAILSWQIFSTNFVGKFFWQVFFQKKYFLMVILRVMIMVNIFFFSKFQKKFEIGP